MPRNVRPSWIEVEVDGKRRLATGPRSKDGTMRVTIYMRDKGAVREIMQMEFRGCGERNRGRYVDCIAKQQITIDLKMDE